jgi:hypothetical protein
MRYTHYDEHKKRWQINNDYGAVMIDELNYAVGEAIDKLAAYEDAEEQGRLVILPCKVGDTIYVIFDGKIWDGKVYRISYSDYYGKITATAWVKQGISAAFEHFGKTVFLTREEAEAALKGETGDV